MDKLNISIIEDITVAQVKSDSGPAGARQAFDKLESRMPGLKGRKMYGVIYPETNEYFACVMLDEEYPDDMGFERSTIPGGSYAKKKIKNWTSKIQKIGAEFQALVKDCIKNGYKIDHVRPSIEFYRSFNELIIMIPVER